MPLLTSFMDDSLSKRFSLKFITNVFSVLISSCISIFIPRYLGPSLYGNFMFLNDHFRKILGFLSLGTTMGFITKISQRRNEIALLRYYIIFLVLIFGISSLGLFLIYVVDLADHIYLDISTNFVVLSFIYSFLLFLVEIFRQINDAYGLTVVSEKYFLIYRIMGLLGLAVFAYYETLDILVYFVIFICTSLFLLFVWFILLRESGVRPFDRMYVIDKIIAKKYTMELYLYSHPLFVKGIVVLVVGLGERWLLQYYGGAEQQGFYSFSFAIASIIILFTTSLTPIFTTDISIAWRNNDLARMREMFSSLIHPLVFITAFLSFFVGSNGMELMELLGGVRYKGAGVSLMILSFYPIHQTYGQVCGALLYASGKTNIVRNVSIPLQLVGFVLLVGLIAPRELGGLNLGSIGLAYKMIILQIIVVNIFLWYCTKLLSLSFLKHLGKQFLIVIILFLISFGCKLFFRDITSVLFFNLLINGVCYLVATIIFIFLYPAIINLKRDDIFRLLKKILRLKK